MPSTTPFRLVVGCDEAGVDLKNLLLKDLNANENVASVHGESECIARIAFLLSSQPRSRRRRQRHFRQDGLSIGCDRGS